MDIPFGQSRRATMALELCWMIGSKRGWTMANHSAPPDCYADMLRSVSESCKDQKENESLVKACVEKMKAHHENMLRLERARHTVDEAQSLWDDCLILNMQPIRLMFEYFRRDRWNPMSPQGRHMLVSLLATLADNKIAEDVHASLRLAAKGNSNIKLSSHTIQDVVNHSKVIEERNIDHGPSVTKDC